MQTQIDHLVIGARTLTEGVNYVKDLLGVDMPFGGVHPKMGTHNHLMRLGNDAFLEIIAVNHDIEPPERPRWFGLDDAFIRQQIEQQPSLLTWVVNTQDIKALMSQSTFSLGKAELISRGNLNWYFGLPDDGRLLAGGMLPYAIEWQTDKHPSANMADLGCRLSGLEIYHPYPRWLQSALSSIGALDLVKVHALPKNEVPYMLATINTPAGIKELSSFPSFKRIS
ncbi:VOC family protein [uncultured Desulfosarcina sp.]|uniref:VOC family protein n=1 Tax=uncultured Desulfosarcina sp. TaxID=218289 RepID=UPI0029C7119B|nr:VOC family protein [uncultured Desulfosarcina sp.]